MHEFCGVLKILHEFTVFRFWKKQFSKSQNVKREVDTAIPVVGVIGEVSSMVGGLEVAVAVIQIMNVNLQTMKASMDYRKLIKAMVIDTANLLRIGEVVVGANPIEADILTSSVVIPLK